MSREVRLTRAKYRKADSATKEQFPGFGLVFFGEIESVGCGSYDSAEESREAVSPENVLKTIGKHVPDALDDIRSAGGIIVNDKWVKIEDMAQVEPEDEDH